jgi:light-harvesting complex I chlorophyll a/b binding protein 5
VLCPAIVAVCSPSSAPAAALLVVQFFLYGFVEIKRWQDFRKPGSQAEVGSFLGFEGSFKGTDNGYPGGPFDPLNLSG